MALMTYMTPEEVESKKEEIRLRRQKEALEHLIKAGILKKDEE